MTDPADKDAEIAALKEEVARLSEEVEHYYHRAVIDEGRGRPPITWKDRAEAAEARVAELEAGMKDACANLTAAASAYRKHASRRFGMQPRATADPFFSTRAQDFDNAADRARALLNQDKTNG